MGQVVVAGTVVLIYPADSCISNVGRSNTVELLTDVPPVDCRQISNELSLTLDLSDVDLKIPLWKLDGRGRLLRGLYSCLATEVKNDPMPSKQILLQRTVDRHYQSILSDTVAKIKKHFWLGEEFGNDGLAKQEAST